MGESRSFSVQVPKGRKFVILEVQEKYLSWWGATGTYSSSILIQGPGFNYNAQPSGSWTEMKVTVSCPPDPHTTKCNKERDADLFYCACRYFEDHPPCSANESCWPAFNQCNAQAGQDYEICTGGVECTGTLKGRGYKKVIPLGDDFAKNGPQTLTVTATAMNGLMGFGLGGDARFTVQQTKRSFRPRDARDPAAECKNNYADCYLTYETKLEYESGGLIMPGRKPPALMSRGRTRVRAMDYSEEASSTDLRASFSFELERPQDGWLQGTSTNYSGTGDTKDTPDYVFEQNTDANGNPLNADLAAPSNGGLKITTNGEVDALSGAEATVTSHDFGGAARLRVRGTIQGMTFDADVLDPDTGENVQPPSCAPDFARTPFVSLPVDQDCNGVADSWEEKYLQGGHFPDLRIDPKAAVDVEKGLFTDGDGFTAHDEYRGFHYVEDDGTTVKWTDTDPVGKYDVFFWDVANDINCAAAGLGHNCLAIGLRNGILGPQTNALISYRRVNAGQANAKSGDVPGMLDNALLGVGKITKNSRDASQAYALVYVDSNNLSPYRVARCDAHPPQKGAIGNAGGFESDGTPIRISFSQVGACASEVSFPPDVFLAQVTAHEGGHKFGLVHPTRVAAFTPFPQDIQSLDLTNYTMNPYVSFPWDAFLRMLRYDYLNRDRVAERPMEGLGSGEFQFGWAMKWPMPPPPAVDCGRLQSCVYNLAVPLAPPGGPYRVVVETQTTHIMDWQPTWTLQTTPQWTYGPYLQQRTKLQDMEVKYGR